MPEGIAWWGWMLIWLALGLGSLAMYTLFARRLVRAGLGLVDDLADLADTFEILGNAEHSHHQPATNLAVLADPLDVRAREAARVATRRQRRDARQERRMARAVEIGSVDVASTEWPAALGALRRPRRTGSWRGSGHANP